jgi:hypothetical protein
LFHQGWASAGSDASARGPRPLRDPFGVERLAERANGATLPERQQAQQRLAALGSPRAVQQLNVALLRLLPRAKQNSDELKGLLELLAPHARDPETQVSLLRVVLGSVGPQGEPIEPELRQMAALAIAAQRDATAVRSLRRALLADTASAQFATAALLAHPPRVAVQLPLQRSEPTTSTVSKVPNPQRPAKTRNTAARAEVAQSGPRLTTARLIELIGTSPAAAPLAACQLAARDEPNQRATLQALLRSPSQAVRVRTLMGLGASPHADATGILLNAYRDSQWQVRWAALYALGQRGDAPSLRALQRAAAIEPNREARDLARARLADGAATRRAACPVILPLASLNDAENDSAIAASSELPEAPRSAMDSGPPHD